MQEKTCAEEIRDRIYDFFIKSNDFNGIPLRRISKEFNIGYEDSIDHIKKLVTENSVSIQSSSNPHIIGFQHYPVESQLKILDDAKGITEKIEKFGEIAFSVENTEYPICLYPSQNYIKANRDLSIYGTAEYTKQLALCEPQLSPKFFEIEVLERYSNDPRFDFDFKDYSGSISCKYDDNDKPIVREEDQVFLKSFGLGFDSEGNRLAVVFLRYLKDLTSEHQLFWKSKEITGGCKILEEYYENAIKGNWTTSYSVFSAFIGELNCLTELSEHIFGVRLFNRSFEEDKRPKAFTFFFIPTLKNYNDFILLLDKMLSENINKDFFRENIDLYELIPLMNNQVERKSKGTLKLLEEWLLSTYNHPDSKIIKDLLKPLKNVRNERQNPAHKISEDNYDLKYIDMQMEMVNSCYSSIRALRTIFQQHPKAKDFGIPDWLGNGKIKSF
ncbi:MAG: hypothetical protein JXA68_00015 [Ignavibacteriales bacterium]|nr:hypothetical protein [Ignavibacteriales bacterium]